VFKVFYSTKKESEGKGLYETKRAAQQIGAELKIASKLKKGTTTKVLIPTMGTDIN